MQHGKDETVVESEGAIRITRFAPALSVKKLELSWALVRALRHVQADILHLQVPNPTMILALLGARPDIPLVVTYNSDVVKQKVLNVLFGPLESLLYRRVRRIMPTSAPYVEGSAFLKRYPERVAVVPMGLELEAFMQPSEAERRQAQELQKKYGVPLWVACGRLIYYKGLHTALEALRDVPGTLLIIGDGPERTSLEKMAANLGVADRVVFVGELPYHMDSRGNAALVPYYWAATALWFPSNARSEAYGLVQVEAMASGCPIINTQIPGSGVPWVSKDGETGLTVPVNDAVAFAAAANKLWNDKALRDRFAQEGPERARREFESMVMARRWIAHYHEVLDGKQINNQVGGG